MFPLWSSSWKLFNWQIRTEAAGPDRMGFDREDCESDSLTWSRCPWCLHPEWCRARCLLLHWSHRSWTTSPPLSARNVTWSFWCKIVVSEYCTLSWDTLQERAVFAWHFKAHAEFEKVQFRRSCACKNAERNNRHYKCVLLHKCAVCSQTTESFCFKICVWSWTELHFYWIWLRHEKEKTLKSADNKHAFGFLFFSLNAANELTVLLHLNSAFCIDGQATGHRGIVAFVVDRK